MTNLGHAMFVAAGCLIGAFYWAVLIRTGVRAYVTHRLIERRLDQIVGSKRTARFRDGGTFG